MLTFLSYNLHSGKDSHGRLDLDAMIDVIRAENPDIAAVQEVACNVSSAGSIDMAARLGDALGMHMVFVPAISFNGGDYGTALLSRHPILSTRAYHIEDIPAEERDRWFEHRMVIATRIDWQGQPITVLSTHLGLSAGERRNGVALLCRLADEAAGPVIAAGDLNTAPDEALLAPLFERLQDGSSAFTYPALAPEVKIDYILASPHWQAQQVQTLPATVSDHLAIVRRMTLHV